MDTAEAATPLIPKATGAAEESTMELDRPGDAGSRRREAIAVERSLSKGQLEPSSPSRPSQEDDEEEEKEAPLPAGEVVEQGGSMGGVVASGSNRQLKCLKTTEAGAGRGGQREERRWPEKHWYKFSPNISLTFQWSRGAGFIVLVNELINKNIYLFIY